MVNFIWLASYPKSGSTWLRFIVAHLLFEVDEKKSLVRAMVPNMHDWKGPLDYSWHDAYPVKTHLAYHNLPTRMGTHCAIYIMRNPLDMVESALNYLCENNEANRKRVIEEFSKNGSIEPWGNTLGYKSWEENVRSWTSSEVDVPVLVLKYEDLLENPFNNIKKISDFLVADADDKKIEDIVRETAFSNMKKIEEVELGEGATGVFSDERLFDKKDYRFMRLGKSGGYRDFFSQSEISRLMDGFGSGMEDFGYS